MAQHNFIKHVYQLTCTNVTPLHIGSGSFLHPNSSLLTAINGELTIQNNAHVSNDTPQEIDAFIDTNGKAFIPGSSVKGAIRSAYLHHWLQTPPGRKNLIQWLKEAIKQVRTYEESSREKQKKIKKRILKAIERSYKTLITEACFGGSKNFEKWHNLRISDSGIENNNTAIYELRRYYLNTTNNGIPTFVEALTPNETFTIALHYIKDQDFSTHNHIGKNLNSIFHSPDAIKKIINTYTLRLLEYEVRVLGYEDVKNSHIKEYENFIKQLKKEIEDGVHNHKLYLRLGAGKLQYYQTMAMAVYNIDTKDEDWDYDAWDAYLAYVTAFKDLEEAVFPKTRVLTMQNRLPMGWVSCEVIPSPT